MKVTFCFCFTADKKKFTIASIILLIISFGILIYDSYLVNKLIQAREGEELDQLDYDNNFASIFSKNYRYVNNEKVYDTYFPPVCCHFDGVGKDKYDAIVIFPIVALILSFGSFVLAFFALIKLLIAHKLDRKKDVKIASRIHKCIDVIIFMAEVSFTIVMINYYFSERDRLMTDNSELVVLDNFNYKGCEFTCEFKDDICYTEFKCVDSEINYYENIRIAKRDEYERCDTFPIDIDGDIYIDFNCTDSYTNTLKNSHYNYYDKLKETMYKCYVNDEYNAECFTKHTIDIDIYTLYMESINDIYGITIIVDSVGDVVDLISLILMLGFFI